MQIKVFFALLAACTAVAALPAEKSTRDLVQETAIKDRAVHFVRQDDDDDGVDDDGDGEVDEDGDEDYEDDDD